MLGTSNDRFLGVLLRRRHRGALANGNGVVWVRVPLELFLMGGNEEVLMKSENKVKSWARSTAWARPWFPCGDR